MRRSTTLFLSLLVGLAPLWASTSKTYKDTVHGIALTYPSDLTMVTDPQTLSQIASGSIDMLHLQGDNQAEIRPVGMQFVLAKKADGAGGVTSINFVVESTQGRGKSDLASYVKEHVRGMQAAGQFKFTQQPTRVTVTGHPCETLAYQVDLKGRKVTGRQYYFYRADKEEGYDFTVFGTDPEVTALLPKNLKVSY